jgi:hypothetical protein
MAPIDNYSLDSRDGLDRFSPQATVLEAFRKQPDVTPH